MRRHSQHLGLNLFPFLAAMMCVLGALIILLMVVTKMIRKEAYANEMTRLTEEKVATDSPAPPVVIPVIPPVAQAPTTPTIELPAVTPEMNFPPMDLSILEEQLAKLRQQVMDAKLRVDANAAQLADLSSRYAGQKQLVQLRQDELNELTKRQASSIESFDAMAMTGEQAAQKLAEAQAKLKSLEAERVSLEEQRAELLKTLTDSQGQLADAQGRAEKIESAIASKQAELKAAKDGFQIIPVDSKNGTTRYPILIECTKNGLQFRPEGLTLGPSEMKGYTTGFNPLLAGTKALMSYWESQVQAGGHRPYILLIVRPSGIESFYAARKYLQPFETEMGYELISDNVSVSIPPLNLAAKDVLNKAVAESLSARNRLAESIVSNSNGRMPQPMLRPDASFRMGQSNMFESPEGSPLFGGGGGSGDSGSAAPSFMNSQGAGSGLAGGPGMNGQAAPPTGGTGAPMPKIASSAPSQSGDLTRTTTPTGQEKTKGGNGNSDVEMVADPNARNYDSTEGRAATDESRENNTNSPSFTMNDAASPMRGGRGASPGGGSPAGQPKEAGEPEEITWSQITKEASTPTSEGAPESVSRLLAKGAITNRAGQIGIEKRVIVYLDADQVQFGTNRPVSLLNVQTSEQFRRIFWAMLESEVAGWKSPPHGFYFTPSVKFFVSPGGNRHYTRIESPLKTLRIPITVEQTLEPRSMAAQPEFDKAFK